MREREREREEEKKSGKIDSEIYVPLASKFLIGYYQTNVPLASKFLILSNLSLGFKLASKLPQP